MSVWVIAYIVENIKFKSSSNNTESNPKQVPTYKQKNQINKKLA